MTVESDKESRLEIAHVLFIDIVGYSKLLINQQSDLLRLLNEIVRSTEQFRAAEKADALVRLPTGDGMALAFFSSPDEPVRCAMEIAVRVKEYPQLNLRMGIHSGPVDAVKDVNDRTNVAGAGINMAQRVMDCGDAGHILLSKRVADDLAQYERWQPHLYDFGECEVKHGLRIEVVNLYTGEVGSQELPEKLRRSRREHAAVESRAAIRARRKVVLGVAAVLLLVATIAALWIRFRSAPAIAADTTAAAAIPEKSIAVLPLVNQSGDSAQEYFSDGLSEELINVLGEIRELRVIGRNSSFRFKGKTDDSRAIGQALRVAHMLEGSVRKAGDRVRISVQLVDTATDSQRWSQTYDRELKDVFAVQEEIARAVADQLRVTLVGDAGKALARPPTENLAAYNAYLEGVFYFAQASEAANLKARSLFEEAIRLDPNYAEAYTGKGRTFIVAAWGQGVRGREVFEQSREALLAARALKPDLATAHGALAWVYTYVDWNLAAAEAELSHVQSEDSAALSIRAAVRSIGGDSKEAVALLSKAVQLDPAFVIWRTNLAGTLTQLQEYEEAESMLRKALELQPAARSVHSNLSLLALLRGQGDVALREAQLEPEGALRAVSVTLAQNAASDRVQADAALESFIATYSDDFPFQVALVYGVRRDAHKVFEWLNRACAARQPGLLSGVEHPLLQRYRSDPRFVELCGKLNIPVPK